MMKAPKTVNSDFVSALMGEALRDARVAASLNEVPIGCVVACQDGSIVGRGHNLVEANQSVLFHAELIAVQEASKRLGNWRLENTLLCVTVEPCPMCIGAILAARIPTLVFGTREPRTGAVGSVVDLTLSSQGKRALRVIEGIRDQECRDLLSLFFQKQRTVKDESDSDTQ